MGGQGMKRIRLINGRYATVDDCDYDFLKLWRWSYDARGETGYATRGTRCNGKSRTVYMHRIVAKRMGLRITRKDVDHIDRNRSNNCRQNLRIATRGQNLSNRPLNRNNTSGFRGVTWDKVNHKWEAKIQVDRRYHKIGRFTDKREAVRKYNEAARKYFGTFASTNRT